LPQGQALLITGQGGMKIAELLTIEVRHSGKDGPLFLPVSQVAGQLQGLPIADQGFGELSQDFVSDCKAPESRDHVRPIPDLPADLQRLPIIVQRFPMVPELTVSRGDSRAWCAVSVSVGCIA